MKKIIILIVLIFFLFSCTNKEKIFIVHYNKNGVKFLQNKIKDFSIIEVDLEEARVKFGGVKLNKKSEFEKFNKYYAKDFLQNYNKNNNKILATINGQFFTNIEKENTALSFPLKSDGKIFTDYIDNDIPKRTFVIDKDGDAKIIEGYKKEYLKNKKYKEIIVAFTPEVTARREDKVGRTYIGLKSSKKIVFFIAKNKNQEQMNKIISDYGIKQENIIMLDGGPSTQFAFKKGNKINQYYGGWEVPQVFVVYKR